MTAAFKVNVVLFEGRLVTLAKFEDQKARANSSYWIQWELKNFDLIRWFGRVWKKVNKCAKRLTKFSPFIGFVTGKLCATKWSAGVPFTDPMVNQKFWTFGKCLNDFCKTRRHFCVIFEVTENNLIIIFCFILKSELRLSGSEITIIWTPLIATFLHRCNRILARCAHNFFIN